MTAYESALAAIAERRSIDEPTSPRGRLWARLEPTEGGCWEWQGAKTSDGYGHISVAGKLKRTHRMAYEILVGAIPGGLVLDHLCRNRACANPDHLEVVSRGENTRRGLAAAALRNDDTCRNGLHPWPESAVQNAYTPRPTCIECGRDKARKWQKEYRARKRDVKKAQAALTALGVPHE